MENRRGKVISDRFPILGLHNQCGLWLKPWNQKMIASWQESDDKPRQCIKKQRNITLLTKVCIVKSVVFPVVVYSWETWTVKEAECQRIYASELWFWRRFLKVPWTARRSKLSILREINREYSLEGLMLKLKLQYFGHLIWTATSLEKSLMLGKIESRGRRGSEDAKAGWHHWCNAHELGQTLGDGEGQGGLACCRLWSAKSRIPWLGNWTITNGAGCHDISSGWHFMLEGRIQREVV